MPDISEDFLKQLMGGEKIGETLASLKENFDTKILELSNAVASLSGTHTPENTPPQPPIVPAPPTPENPVPQGAEKTTVFTFRRHGRGMKLAKKEEVEKPTSQAENKDKNNSGQKTA